MKFFHCDHCQHLVCFENVSCLKCGHKLAFLPDINEMGSLDPLQDGNWQSQHGKTYRLCGNYTEQNICNWAIPAELPDLLCESCRLTTVIPDLQVPGNKEKWYRLEVAKRRLIHSLLRLDLLPRGGNGAGVPPAGNAAETAALPLCFEFLADSPAPEAPKILTGHEDGRITINIAEADDAQREQLRLAMHEPYRTVIGHFRHEIGHYYWDRLIAQSELIEPFRGLFGDERQDYAQALKNHYEQGPPADWPEHFVSGYAASHPWEDWAETWAHYLHIVDALETAAESGLWLRPNRPDEPAARPAAARSNGRARRRSSV